MTSYDLNKEKFFTLVKKLAVYFSDYDLTISENHYRGLAFFTFKKDDSKIFCLAACDKGKFVVSSRIDKKPHHSFDVYVGNDKLNPPEVGFSIDRPAEKIADGIKKRFMPDFEAYFNLWIAKWNQIESAKNNKEAVIKELALLMGGVDITDYNRSGIRENLSSYNSNNKGIKAYVDNVFVSSADSIQIKTNYLTREQAKKMLEFIKGL
jgi:hypothetical protein